MKDIFCFDFFRRFYLWRNPILADFPDLAKVGRGANSQKVKIAHRYVNTAGSYLSSGIKRISKFSIFSELSVLGKLGKVVPGTWPKSRLVPRLCPRRQATQAHKAKKEGQTHKGVEDFFQSPFRN
jgi:hypothetical protein